MYGSGGGMVTGGGAVAGGTLAYTGADPHVAIVVAALMVTLGAGLAVRKRLLDRRLRTINASN